MADNFFSHRSKKDSVVLDVFDSFLLKYKVEPDASIKNVLSLLLHYLLHTFT